MGNPEEQAREAERLQAFRILFDEGVELGEAYEVSMFLFKPIVDRSIVK